MSEHVVHKATLGGRITSVEMPKGAEVVHVELQHDNATLWFRCDPDLGMETRYFQAFETGFRKIPPSAVFMGTVLFDRGNLVYHVFEVFPPLSNGV